MSTEVMNQEKQAVFEFLDDLRESGATNMFGAAPYVQEEFGFDKRLARSFVIEWMETFSERHGKQSQTT